MKKIAFLLFCAFFASCGSKTNEDLAKELIKQKLKTSLPDFSKYSSLNFGTMGTAFLPYEETNQYKANKKALSDCKDSIAALEKIIRENKAAENASRESLQQLIGRANAKSESNRSDKQGYVPEKLFKLTHAYTIEDETGAGKKTEDEFFIDKDFKQVVKVIKVY
jgi:hypothetical protein